MRLVTLAVLVLGLLTAACSGSGRAARADAVPVPLSEKFGSLGDAVRTLPNLQVSGNSVIYGGTNSLTGGQEVQFLVDKRIVGSLAQAADLYPLTEIRRVRFIRPQQAASAYGALGNNGLVELILMP